MGVNTHNVFRFEVQVDDALLMHEGNPFQDLLHVAHTGRLSVLKAVVHNTFKQFPACDTTDRQSTVATKWLLYFFLCTQNFAVFQPLWELQDDTHNSITMTISGL